MTDAFYGHCDACSGELRGGPGRVVKRAVDGIGTIGFRFCSHDCKEAFFDRESVTEVPHVG